MDLRESLTSASHCGRLTCQRLWMIQFQRCFPPLVSMTSFDKMGTAIGLVSVNASMQFVSGGK